MSLVIHIRRLTTVELWIQNGAKKYLKANLQKSFDDASVLHNVIRRGGGSGFGVDGGNQGMGGGLGVGRTSPEVDRVSELPRSQENSRGEGVAAGGIGIDISQGEIGKIIEKELNKSSSRRKSVNQSKDKGG